MLASRLALRSLRLVDGLKPKLKSGSLIYRNFQSDAKENVLRRAARIKLGQKAEITDTPLRIGSGFLAGASALGIGALAFYGLGFSKESGIVDRSIAWPDFVRERIGTTYQYFGASLGITAASAYAVSRSPALMNLATKNSLLAIFASFAAVIGSGMLVRSIPYQEGTFGSKQLAWAFHAALLGGLVAPLTLLGGPLLLRAAMYTGGAIGGLSIVAATAPSEKFLNMSGPLSLGLGVVFAASLGSAFLPPTTKLGLSLYSLSIYGGLVLFSMLLLYDTQKIVKKSETAMYYDPVNESISIYMDTLNIFIRIVQILAMGGNRRR